MTNAEFETYGELSSKLNFIQAQIPTCTKTGFWKN